MKKDDNYFKVITALKKLKDEMSKNKATEAIMNDTDISRQTVLNAIETGIRSGKISVEESYEGKRKSLLISIPSEIKDNEDLIFEKLDDMFSKYEENFELFTTNLKNLETDDKGDGIDTFYHFLLMARNLVSFYSKIFSKDGRWIELSDRLDKRIEDILSIPNDKILEYLIEQREYDVVDAFDEIEEFLEDNKIDQSSN